MRDFYVKEKTCIFWIKNINLIFIIIAFFSSVTLWILKNRFLNIFLYYLYILNKIDFCIIYTSLTEPCEENSILIESSVMKNNNYLDYLADKQSERWICGERSVSGIQISAKNSPMWSNIPPSCPTSRRSLLQLQLQPVVRKLAHVLREAAFLARTYFTILLD